jgi:hypothetical protein
MVDRDHQGTNAFANVPHAGADATYFRIRIFVLHAEAGRDRIDEDHPEPHSEALLHFLIEGLELVNECRQFWLGL